MTEMFWLPNTKSSVQTSEYIEIKLINKLANILTTTAPQDRITNNAS